MRCQVSGVGCQRKGFRCQVSGVSEKINKEIPRTTILCKFLNGTRKKSKKGRRRGPHQVYYVNF